MRLWASPVLKLVSTSVSGLWYKMVAVLTLPLEIVVVLPFVPLQEFIQGYEFLSRKFEIIGMVALRDNQCV